jgi:diguanylate cyclase (GGDEF)-like protein
MKRRGVWAGRGLAVLGLAAVTWAVSQAHVWALVAALAGFLAATGLVLGPLMRLWLAERPLARPTDFEHAIDLLRRAHGALAGWIVGLQQGEVEVVAKDAVRRETRRRGSAIVQLASVDGRAHVAREEEGTYIAVGDFPFGAGLLLAEAEPGGDLTAAVAEELRRIVASLRLAALEEPSEQAAQLVAKQLAMIAGGARTLEGIAKAGVELAQQFAQRGTAIVLHGVGPAPSSTRVVAVSTAGDSRLAGLVLANDAPAVRAIQSGVPIVTRSSEDVFGNALPDRRRHERAGTAYPIFDGHFVIGSLVVTGPPIRPGSPVADQLDQLLAALGSRLAAARAVYDAELRAVSDPLTGLRNVREFERRLAVHSGGDDAVATLIYADLDRFKTLNDTLGHAAGDSALRHVAEILKAAVRDQDLVARIGGEEFAIWMPHSPVETGLEVAERIRQTVERTTWHWDATAYPITLSCGVAAYPDSVRDIKNLRSAADAALYRAKEHGRNRVEKAPAAG